MTKFVVFENAASEEFGTTKGFGGIQRKQTLVQYVVSGNSFVAADAIKPPETVEKLAPGIYTPSVSYSGEKILSIHECATDELIRFKDERHELVLSEIDNFWKSENKYKEAGFTHKRGVLLSGAPGTGKSCIIKLVMEDTVKKGDVVFVTRSVGSTVACLKAFREIEPKRKVLCVMEDLDELIRYDEHSILELFDGDNQMDHVLALATTNYPERLPARILRPGRFDRKLEIGLIPEAGRRAYFQKKLGEKESFVKDIDTFTKLTKDFSFAQMREFLVATYCLGHNPVEAANRVREGRIE